MTSHHPIQGHRSESTAFASQDQCDVDGYSQQLIQRRPLVGKGSREREMKDFLWSDSEEESICALNHSGEELISLH